MNNEARQVILDSIRAHLAASVPADEISTGSGSDRVHLAHKDPVAIAPGTDLDLPLVNQFKENLESVSGHCYLVHGKTEMAQVVTEIINKLRAQRIAISDAPELAEFGVIPSRDEIFSFDVGITTAQAAIAETGTLVLDSSCERHRLVSVVPPVHIAILPASRICATLSEALAKLQNGKEISPTITFITGPSRTADIELTLTIGVHGPQELYVIIDESN
jgi:L-lactate dehydrogenase complex protein LldG